MLPPAVSAPALAPRRLRVVFLAAALLGLGLSGARADDTAALVDRSVRPLLVGAADDSYPYSYLTPAGRCEGFAVDLMDAAARVMDLQIERVHAPAREIQARFQSGEFDLLQMYSQGPDREAYADFSISYLHLQGSLFVRRNDTRIRAIDDLKGREIVIVGIGSVGEKLIRDHHLEAKIVHLSSIEEGLRQLDAGTYDALFASRLTALSIIDRLKLRNLRPLGSALEGYDLRLGFAVHKGDAAVLSRLNEGLAILHRTGEFDDIYRRWFGRFDSPVFTREQVITYVAAALGIAWLAACWGMLRQRALRKRIARQAAELAEQESILAEAQQIAHVGHWRYDAAQKRLACSAETLRIFEHDPAQPPPSHAELLLLIAPAERSAAQRALREAFKIGTSCDLTLSLVPRPGTRKIVHLTARPMRDPHGQTRALFGTIQDITRQKAAEEGLRTREQLLHALYDNVPNAMGVVEAAGSSFCFVSANPGTSRLLGMPAVPLVGRVLAELPLPPATITFWHQWFRQGIDAAEIVKTEHLLDDNRRHYAITLVPLGGDAAQAPQLCFLVEDITERKQMDAEIAQGRRLRAVGELVGGIAHEFNNLLTPVMLKAELLSSEWRHDPRVLEELQTITKAAQRGADLTRRLLAFGRRSDPHFEEIQLQAIVRANFDLLRPTIDRRIRLDADVSAKLPKLFLNPSDLHQILLNLLLNARDTLMEKLDQGGRDTANACIRVEAAEFGASAIDAPSWESANRPKGWVCLVVRDNGLGMRREVLERIFEPFYTTKEVGKGTGLGLATVWHLVTRLGGKITVHSTPGEGSAFNVWLPVLTPALQPGDAPTALPATTPTGNPTARILLVEDDELVAQTVATALRRYQHHVTHYAHGAEAWRHLSTHQNYDLLVLDLDLPGLSGLEIARRVRATRFAGKILVASGRLTEVESRELTALQIEGRLEKPFTPQTLNLAVQACLQAARRGPAVPPPAAGATPIAAS